MMSNTNNHQRECIDAECQRKMDELLQINGMWERDYNELFRQHQQLKARSTTSNTSLGSSTMSNRVPSNAGTSLHSPTIFSSSQTRERNQQPGKATTVPPSYNISPTTPPTFSRSMSTSNERGIRTNDQQPIFQRAEGYTQCAVTDIERMKEQIRTFKSQYEWEREEKEKEISKSKNLKRKLTENEEITFHLHQRIDNLEKKLRKAENDRTSSSWATCASCEQQRKAELMRRDVFPRNEHHFTGYKEERDSMSPNVQQHPHHHQHQRGFEGGTMDHKHPKFRQIYPLIY